MEPLDPSSRWLIRKYIPELSAQQLDSYDSLSAHYVALVHSIPPEDRGEGQAQERLVRLRSDLEAAQAEGNDARIREVREQIQNIEAYLAMRHQAQDLLGPYVRPIGRIQRLQLARRRIAVRKGKYGLTLRGMTRDLGFKSMFDYGHYYGTWVKTMPSLMLRRLHFLMYRQF